MRKVAVIALLLASCTLGAAHGNEPPQSGNWFTRMWSFGDTPEQKKAPETDKKSDEVSAVDLAARQHTREEVILNRRNQVILKLREIAQMTHDDELLRKADTLQERAWEVYLQRTASTPASGGEARPSNRETPKEGSR